MRPCPRILLIVSLLCAACVELTSAQDVSLVARDSTAIVVDAGGVGTRLVSISVNSGGKKTIRLLPTLPTGWSVLIPSPNHQIDEGQTVHELISFQVPGDAPAGMYSVLVTAEDLPDVSFRLNVRVRQDLRIRAEWIRRQKIVRAGSLIHGALAIVNAGNAPGEWAIQVRSSLGYPVTQSSGTVRLNSGESEEVEVSVRTGDDATSVLAHSLVVEINTGTEGNAPPVLLSFVTDVLPGKRNASLSREGVLPVTVSMTGSVEEDDKAGQLELALEETVVDGRIYEALIRTPDVRNTSVFAAPDRYSFRITATDWEMMLGDHTYESTELLESGTLGFGAGAQVQRTSYSAGAWAQRSRRVFPKGDQAAAFIHYRVNPSFRIEANAIVKRDFEEGEAISIAAQSEPGSSFMRAEYAIGWFGGQRGDAMQVRANTSWGQSSFSFQAEKADNSFLGSIQNTEGASSAVVVSLSDWLRVEAQARGRRRHYDLSDGSIATQTIGSGRAGFTLIHSGDRSRLFISVAGVGQFNENTLSRQNRKENGVEGRIGLNRRRFGLNATLAAGQTRDPISPKLDSNRRGSASVFATRGGFSFNMSGSYTDGPTFYNPVPQERMTLGFNAGWDTGARTRVNVGIFRSKDLTFSNQEFTLADARIVHRFPFMHEVTLRARMAQTDFDSSIRSGTVGFTYSIPLYVPAPGSGRNEAPKLKGRVVDIETGLPLSDVVVLLDTETAATQEDGSFEFDMGSNPAAYLSIDRQSIGFERRPVDTFPMLVSAQSATEGPLVIGIVRSGRLEVKVAKEEGQSQNRDSALSKELDANAVAGLIVEIRGSETRMRRLTDRDGTARFSDLVPGQWRVFIVGSSLPAGYETRPDTAQVQIDPVEDELVELTLIPKIREIKIVSPGGVLLGKAISLGAPRQADAEAPNDEEQLGQPDALEPKGQKLHVVAAGETLSILAEAFYGSSSHWIRIWKANQNAIPNPNVLQRGQALVIPKQGPLTAEETAALNRYRADDR